MSDLKSRLRQIAADGMKNSPSEAEVERESRLLVRAAREERLEAARGVVPEEDFEALVRNEELAPTAALVAVRGWRKNRASLESPMTMLVILGETGRGKTVASLWLMAELGGVYVTAEELRRLSRSYGGRDRDDLDRLIKARVLVVDDVGTEQDEESAASAMFEVVNRRMGLARGWTILTGNLTTAQFQARYGERTTRRIHHQGAFVEVSGGDLRRGGT